jgi:tRNA (cytidine/uridine-2'-O-)-methyltransferase
MSLLLPHQRLRARPTRNPFYVVLVEPEIPPNTGNIARICAGTGCPLHLVGTLGFRIDEHAVRRAGLDYWHLVNVQHHPNLGVCEAAIGQQRGPDQVSAGRWFLSGRAKRSIYDVEISLGDTFVFGKESVGLGETLLEQYSSNVIGIPTLGEIRSLNLANAVAVVIYEALRQQRLLGVGAGCSDLPKEREVGA